MNSFFTEQEMLELTQLGLGIKPKKTRKKTNKK